MAILVVLFVSVGDQTRINSISSDSYAHQGPDRLEALITVLEVRTDQEACGKVYNMTLVVRIDKIIASGRTITNPISQGMEIPMLLENTLTNLLTKESAIPVVGQTAQVIAKEKLCLLSEISMMSILQYKPV
ncbi:MAG: hypothetical protein ABJF11_10500 [Reichenbachiella sp.]|uniref:hypothetical protein n=1 Tax=Reichenbachiella sp. TaxID=2184521 RepID=UPI003262FF5E